MSIRKNTLWNLFGSIGPMLIGIAAIPYLLQKLGVGRLGVLTLIWALIGYFGIFDFGLGRAITYKVSTLKAHGRMDRAIGSIKFGLVALMGMGVTCALLVTAVVYTFGIFWLNVDPQMYGETFKAILVAGAAIPITTITSGLRGVLEGLENFRVANILKTLLGFSNFLFPVATVEIFGSDLFIIVCGLLGARLVVMLLHVLVIATLLRPFKSAPAGAGDDSRDLARFGAWMTISNIISPLMTVSDRFFISHFVGAANVAFYSVPSDFMSRLLLIPSALTTTLFPVFAQQQISGKDRRKELHALYYKAMRSIVVLMLPITFLIAAFSYWGLYLWLGKAFAQNSYVVVILLSFGIFFNSLAQIPFAVIQAAGDAKKTSLVHLIEFVVYMPFLVYGVAHFGIVAAALAWQLRMLGDLIILHSLAVRKINYER